MILLHVLLLLLAGPAPIRASHQNACFLAPYITSFRPSLSGNNVTLTFVLDYKHQFVVRDIVLAARTGSIDANFDRSRAQTLRDPSEDPTEIIYREDRLKTPQGLFTLMESKRQYFQRVANLDKSLITKLDCSPFYIYDAVYVRQLNETHFLEVHYHRLTRCFRFFSMPNGKTTYTRLKSIPFNANDNYWRPLGSRRVTSAALMLPYLFELNPDGLLLIRRFSAESDYPSATKQLGGNYEAQLFELYSGLHSSRGTFVPFIRDHICERAKHAIIPDLLAETIADYNLIKPLRTVFKIQNRLYGFTSYIGDLRFPEAVVGLGQVADKNQPLHLDPTKIIPFNGVRSADSRVESLSVAEKDGQILDKQALFRSFSTGEYYYVFNDKVIKILPTLADMHIPEDIVHWTSCKKIIAFYGFFYVMHDYNQSIYENPITFNPLDESKFDYPIEAVYADEDIFFFFTKATTVQVMRADSSDCSSGLLTFTNIEEIHIQQLFKRDISQLLLEGRYYDGSKWKPDKLWPKVATETVIWPYLVALLVITAVFLILILVYILKRTEQARGDTIYSISRSSTAIKSDPRQASSMPLFSHHHSLKSVVKSAGKLIETPRRSLSPIKKAKKSPSSVKSLKKVIKKSPKTRSPRKSSTK